MQELILTEDALPELADKIVGLFEGKEVLYLSGELGAGKTALVRAIMGRLGYFGRVKSPSYSLAETYEVNGVKVAHLDLYRIDNLEELLYLSLDDYALESDYMFIEWAPDGSDLLPPATIKVDISVAGDRRKYNITRLVR